MSDEHNYQCHRSTAIHVWRRPNMERLARDWHRSTMPPIARLPFARPPVRRSSLGCRCTGRRSTTTAGLKMQTSLRTVACFMNRESIPSTSGKPTHTLLETNSGSPKSGSPATASPRAISTFAASRLAFAAMDRTVRTDSARKRTPSRKTFASSTMRWHGCHQGANNRFTMDTHRQHRRPALSPLRHTGPVEEVRGRWGSSENRRRRVSANHPYALDLRRHFQTDAFTEKQVRGLRQGYLAGVDFVDVQLGRLLDALDGSGFRDNTIVVYTSDHGEMLGKFGMWWKCSMYEDSLRVPLIVSGPGFPSGKRSTTPVSLFDLQAMLFRATGATRPAHWWGTPLQDIPVDDQGSRGIRGVSWPWHEGGNIHDPQGPLETARPCRGPGSALQPRY